MIKKLLFHVCETKTRKEVNKFITLADIVNKIQNGDAYTAFIEAFRAGGKDMPLYEPIQNGRECILWNANSIISKSTDKNVMQGLIHFQKHNMDKQLISSCKGLLKALECVVCVFTSFDGKGIECLVRLDGITPNNFEKAWQEINESIGLEFAFIALENSEPTLISYDPGVYFNPLATSFQAKKTFPLKAITIPEKHSFSVNQEPLSEVQLDLLYNIRDRIAPLDYDYSNSKFRYKTELHDHVFGEKEYKFFPNGIDFYESKTYHKVSGDKRKKTMYAQAATLMVLNPDYDMETFIERVWQINLYQCTPILSKSLIEYIVKNQYSRLEDGTLKVKPVLRKLVYKTDCSLQLEQKQVLHANFSAVGKIQKSYKSIKADLQMLMETGKKVVQKNLIDISNMSERTVKYYWKRYFKDEVLRYNKNILGTP